MSDALLHWQMLIRQSHQSYLLSLLYSLSRECLDRSHLGYELYETANIDTVLVIGRKLVRVRLSNSYQKALERCLVFSTEGHKRLLSLFDPVLNNRLWLPFCFLQALLLSLV